MRRARSLPVGAVVVVAVALLAAPAAGTKKKDGKLDPDRVTPLIFVHGGSGSGAQFESQQMRMTSNGFPQRYIHVLEYDTLASLDDTIDEVHANLDALIERVKAKTGKPQVDVLGHSRGTTVMHEYLASPERAANVRRYVNIDGRTSDSPPGGVETLAIWAGVRTLDPGEEPTREIGGAQNVTIPNQTHVQVATSEESFTPVFRFLVGKKPETDEIEKGKRKVKIAGRAVVFPLNVGVPAGTELDVWRLKPGTGERTGKTPVAEPALAADGSWGPLKLLRGKRYEFALTRPDGVVHHLYPEPFHHNDRLVRLLSSVTGKGVELLLEPNDANSGMVITRYKEFWGDHGGGRSDVLTVEAQNVVTPAVSPISNTTNAVFVFDDDSDGMSDLGEPNPLIAALPFLTHADLFIPAGEPPNDTVEVSLRSRGRGPTRSLNFPNFRSSTNRVSLMFNDYEKR
jgi:Lipase C-terminal domain/AF_1763-like, C-terminal domain/Lipase (class 2)